MAILLLISSSPGGLNLTPCFPRSVIIIDWLINVGLAGGMTLCPARAGRSRSLGADRRARLRARRPPLGDRGWRERDWRGHREGDAEQPAKALEMLPIGFVDVDAGRTHMSLRGIPILGGPERLERLIKDYTVNLVIIALPDALGRVVREIVKTCEKADVEFKIILRSRRSSAAP